MTMLVGTTSSNLTPSVDSVGVELSLHQPPIIESSPNGRYSHMSQLGNTDTVEGVSGGPNEERPCKLRHCYWSRSEILWNQTTATFCTES